MIKKFLDLGLQPFANKYLSRSDLNKKKLENILRYGLKYYSEKRQFGKFIVCILKLLIKYGFKRNLSFIINKRYLGLTA